MNAVPAHGHMLQISYQQTFDNITAVCAFDLRPRQPRAGCWQGDTEQDRGAPQSHGTRAVAVRLLDTPSGRSRLAGGLGSQLLPGRLATGAAHSGSCQQPIQRAKQAQGAVRRGKACRRTSCELSAWYVPCCERRRACEAKTSRRLTEYVKDVGVVQYMQPELFEERPRAGVGR